MKDIRAHVFIEGKVQGVFYRTWTFRQAQDLHLTGWVKNLADGRVEAVFEGPEEKVNQIIKECKKGSRASDVDHIDVNMEEAIGEFDRFEVRY